MGKTKDRGAFYKGYKGERVVYLPGDINGPASKLQLIAAEFFAGNTTVRNESVHVLDALLRLKQVTRKEYTNIAARLAVRFSHFSLGMQQKPCWLQLQRRH